MKNIILNENQYYRLFESDENDTPQNFLQMLKQKGKMGILPNSTIQMDKVLRQIQNELTNNEDLSFMNGQDNINYFGFLDVLQKQNNKLYVERGININHVTDILSYDGLGTSWSWCQGGAEAYFGNGDISVILRGHVRLDDVDWEKTTFLNAYPLNEQKEIRIQINKPIEIHKFTFNGKTYKLNKPLLIDSGSTDIGI